MLDYSITGVYFKGAEQINPDITDFTDFPACFNAMQDSLAFRPGARASILFTIEEEDPDEDHNVNIRYGFSGHDGKIVVSVVDEDGITLTQGYVLEINRDTEKLRMIRMDGRDDTDTLDEAIKIIQDYGVLIVAGINWGAYLLHENAAGRLQQHFEATYQEIH